MTLPVNKQQQTNKTLKGLTHVGPVPEGGVEGLLVVLEQILDVSKAFDLENLRLFLNDLPAGSIERQLVSSFFHTVFLTKLLCKTPSVGRKITSLLRAL